jgi:site-specific DNA-cytosine methylase
VSRIPFGVEPVLPQRVPSLRSVIGDLEDLATTWEQQPYRRPASWWTRTRRSESGLVDGHQWRSTLGFWRAMDLIAPNGSEGLTWPQGERMNKIVRRYYQEHGNLPDTWNPSTVERLIRTDFWCGVAELTRWWYDKPAYVITGAGLETVLHPTLNRCVTHREVARIMGFPDDWRIWPLRQWKSLHPTWGKGIPVDCGRWISGWARSSILGEPGTMSGEPIGDREYLIDVTNDWKNAVVV